MKNILYIASPTSIHDIKWMSYFSTQQDKYRVYALGEKQNGEDTAEVKAKLQAYNIELLPPIDSFSISSPLRTLSSISMLRTYISRYNIDLVHILFATPHALWANYIKIPYIITTRGSDALIVLPSLLSTTGLRGIYDRVLLRLFKKAFKHVRINTATSVAQSDRLKELFQIDNIEIIRTGVDVDKIAVSKDQALLNPLLIGQPYVLSSRFMSPLYNIEVQIDAIQYLPKEIKEKHIFVFIRGKAYDSAYYDRMKAKLEKLQTTYGIRYHIEDYLGQEELWTYYNYASLTVMTPRSDGTPNSALEAMSAKCPLIMPDLPYDKYIFENTCLVLTDNSADKLATLMEKALLSYPQELIETAYLRAKEHGNRSVEMAKLEKLYS